MCGIVGMVLWHGELVRWEHEIARLTDLMTRRGPDRAGLWSSESGCVLGFRRLSILDLSDAGSQPMITPDGRYALVYNGELYNYREVRASLQHDGVTFRSTGDAEVVLHALARRGVGALQTFNGMFALGFYDTREKRLLLARDHAGIKPLYVLRHQGGVLFASQFDQLLQHPWGRSRSLDSRALELYFNLGYLPPPSSLLENSATLEPGSWIEFRADGTERGGRWFQFPQYAVPDLRGAIALEAVDAAVTAAVRRQLVSDVPLGVLLSGGIDSPLVATKAQAILGPGTRLPAFTLGTAGTKEDESADAARYADGLALRHVVRHITSDDVPGLLDDVVTACSEPLDDFSMFPTALISRVAREEVTVVLSGDGGDDLFWGYPGRMIHPLVGADESWAVRLRGQLASMLGRSRPKPFTGATQFRTHRFVSREALQAVFPNLGMDFPELRLFAFDGGSADRLAQWLRWNEYSAHLVRVLQKVDRASMHASLEVRVPLLDREVVDVASRIDWRTCVDLPSRTGKLPLRAALRRHVAFQTIAKRGFDVPMSDWLRGPLKPVVEDLVLSRNELLGMPVGVPALRRLFECHQRASDDSTNLLWRLLSLALWEQRHYRPMLQSAASAVAIA